MNRRLLIGAGAAVVVVLAAWYLLLWRPAGDDLAAADARYDDARAQNAELRTQIARLEERELERPALQSELGVLQAAIPEEAQQAELLLSIDEAADESGVDFLILQAGDLAADPSGLGSIQVNVSGDGGYFQVLDFLNRIASTQRIVLVDTLSLTATEAADQIGPPDLTWTFTLRAFTTAPPSEIAPAGAEAAEPATDESSGAAATDEPAETTTDENSDAATDPVGADEGAG